MSATVTPYFVLGERRCAQLAASLTLHARRWRAHWSGADAPADVEIESCAGHPAKLWRHAATSVWSHHGAPTVFAPDDLVARLAGVAPGEPAGQCALAPRLVDALEARIIADLGSRLTAVTASGAYAHGSHAVAEVLRDAGGRRGLLGRIHFADAQMTLGIVLAPSLVAMLLGEPRPKALPERVHTRLEALGEAGIRLRMTLGTAHLSLGELRELRAGDIVVLDEELNASGQLAIAGGETAARAVLGRVDHARAVQISSLKGSVQ